MKVPMLMLVVPTLLFFGSPTSAPELDQVQIETVPVADGIFMLVGSGGNIGVSVGRNGVLLIDTQYESVSKAIEAAISKLNDGPVRFVLNTNWHHDHVRGNAHFAQAGATIVAHATSRERMMTDQSHPDLEMEVPAYPDDALPFLTFTDELVLHFNDDVIHAFHLEGAHSDADLAFYFRTANVLHAGDLFFVGGYPFIDVPHGGSIDGMIAAADQLLGMVDGSTKVIPGHGPLSDRRGLQGYREMLATVRDRIAGQIKEGKSLEEIVSSRPTADFDAGMGRWMPADDFVTIVFNDLANRSY
jgi:glyoxylase-like metal-dependent hydrolase (beta-lactamase superfamily II)